MSQTLEVKVKDWFEGEQIDGKIVVVKEEGEKAGDEPFGIALHLNSQAEEIPEGCAPESFGPGRHFLYPHKSLNREQTKQLRDHLTTLLGE